MLHGEEAKFVSLHCEQAVSRDLECIRKMHIMVEVNIGLLFQKSTAVLASKKCTEIQGLLVLLRQEN